MKNSILIALLLSVVSCEFLDEGYMIGTRRSDVFRDNISREKVKDPELLRNSDTIIYVTGVDFPKEYDWRRDTAYGGVRSEIVIFANGKKIRNIPAGDEFQISPNPGRHWLVEGKLYTDYCDSGVTIIKRDGEEIIRYDGMEAIKGFLVKEDKVYTLGQNLDGKGFSLRCNGEKIFSSKNGSVVGNMCDFSGIGGALEDNNGPAFKYYTYSISSLRRWYYYHNGKEEEIVFDNGVMQVYDICVHNEKLYYLTYRYGRISVNIGDDTNTLHGPTAKDITSCRIIVIDNQVFVRGEAVDYKHNPYTVLWNLSGHMEFALRPGSRAMNIFYENKQYSFPMINKDSDLTGIYSSGKWYDFKEKAYVLSNACTMRSGDKFYVACTSVESGHNPFLWVNGEIKTIGLNGYLTSVEVFTRKSKKNDD